MYIYKYKIAGITIELELPFECEETARFQAFRTEENADIVIRFGICKERPRNTGELVYSSDIHVFQNDRQLCIEHFLYVAEKPYAWLIWDKEQPDNIKCFVLEEDVKYCKNIAHIFQLIRLEQICMLRSGMILHTSFIKWKEEAILFTAPSGTGKSTQASLWGKYNGAEVINGDRAILRNIDNEWTASGLPYAGSSNIFKNQTVKISAIVVLRQGIDNEIRKLRPVEAFKWLYSEMVVRSWEKDFQEKLAENLTELVKSVPVYYFSCLPDKSAVEKLENYLGKEV